MAINLDNVVELNRVLADRKLPRTFLLDMFFPGVIRATNDLIFFERTTERRRLAPFVSPLREGRVVDMPGFSATSFRPAYVKDKRVFDPNKLPRRMAGERIGGETNPVQRRDAAVLANMQDQLLMLTRREEWMASSVLRTGAVTVSGEGHPTQVVNFGRPGGHTVVLAGASRWGQAGISPLANLKTWALTVQANNGGFPNTVVMDPLAYALFEASQDVKDIMSRRATRGEPSLLPELPWTSYVQNSEAQVMYMGSIGVFDIYTYQAFYEDEDLVVQKMIPDNTVIMGNIGWADGCRCYGYVKDDEANFVTDRFFVKSWTQKDPGVRFMLLQSAPLVVPFRPEATFCATVN